MKPGSGLGLNIVNETTKMYGGSVNPDRSPLGGLVELEKERNRARSRCKPQPLRFRPVTIGDLIREGKLLEVHCSNCRPERHLYPNPEVLRRLSACRCQTWLGISPAASATRETRGNADEGNHP
jgi:hypothetical protein